MAIQGLGAGAVGYGLFSNGTDTPISQQVLNAQKLMDMTIKYEPDIFKSTGFNAGRLQDIDTVIKKDKFSMEIGWSTFDKQSIELLLGRFQATTSSYTYKTVKEVKLNGSAQYTDSDLVGKTAAEVQCSLIRNGSGDEGYLITAVSTNAPVAATTMSVDATNGKLIGHSSLANRTVAYSIDTALTTVKTIGYEKTAKKFETLKFAGILAGPNFPDGLLVVVNNLSRESGWEMAVAAETQAKVTFTVLLDSGSDFPINFIVPPSGFTT